VIAASAESLRDMSAPAAPGATQPTVTAAALER
jgi:hypothetical protein